MYINGILIHSRIHCPLLHAQPAIAVQALLPDELMLAQDVMIGLAVGADDEEEEEAEALPLADVSVDASTHCPLLHVQPAIAVQALLPDELRSVQLTNTVTVGNEVGCFVFMDGIDEG